MLISLPNAFGDAATNMAIDAALLDSIPSGLAAFRHYAWLEPASTFGYAQRYQDVVSALVECPLGTQASAAISPNQASDPTTLVRRLTGGGIVDHRNDWTYALILHTALPSATSPATQLYQQIHQAIRLALSEMSVESQLAPCPKACNSPHPASRIPHPASRIPHPALSHCFITPAANDVLRPDGQKIAGAAMKRTRHGLLIQGSLDRSALPPAFDYPTFQAQLLTQLAAALHLPLGQLEDIRPLFNSARIEQEKQRFASEAWNQRR